MTKCSTCGKVTTPKGSKGDTGATGASGAGVLENYFAAPATAVNNGVTDNIDQTFGTSTLNAQKISYMGVVNLRGIAATEVTITPYGTSVLSAEAVKVTMPPLSGLSPNNYLQVPIAGDMIVDVSGTTFGINVQTASNTQEITLMSINVNFTRG